MIFALVEYCNTLPVSDQLYVITKEVMIVNVCDGYSQRTQLIGMYKYE